jgi:hypothetical protein
MHQIIVFLKYYYLMPKDTAYPLVEQSCAFLLLIFLHIIVKYGYFSYR